MILPKNVLSYVIISHRHNYPQGRRAPLCISVFPIARGRKFQMTGSITVEAALVIPLFFCAVLSLGYLLEVMAVRTGIRSGMQYAGKIAAQEAAFKPVLIPAELESDIVEAVGQDRLDRSVVQGGSGGIRCEKSYMSPATAVMELRVNYKVYLPIPLFGDIAVPMEERSRVKGWTGYEKTGIAGGEDDVVYITETGMVYHKDYHCTYLDLSIQMASAGEVEKMRNKSGGKYNPCQSCAQETTSGAVYITAYGDRYHRSLSCSGLKRTIYAVPISEAAGKGACSKCGGTR